MGRGYIIVFMVIFFVIIDEVVVEKNTKIFGAFNKNSISLDLIGLCAGIRLHGPGI